jgi:ribosomal protein S19E (S16A)
LDYILLKLLYNPAIKSGMTKANSRKILRKHIQQLFKSGEIQQANRKVNQSGMYPLITGP